MSPYVSLLMPTRNRSAYLRAGVGYFLDNAQSDAVELIVCDASDDPATCEQALSPWRADSRLTVLDNTVASTGRLSAMTENWSRALDAARGQWVIIVGDDDVCDPAVVLFLQHLERALPDCQAVTWHRAHYDIDIAVPREAKIPMGTRVMLAAGRDSVLKQAQWPNAKRPPSSLCSPYHGAVRREALLALKQQRGGWFAFATPDYDLGWSLAWQLERFAICERPFSITGVCPKSNSYSVRNEEKRGLYMKNWMRESRALDGWGETNDPFLFSLPMTVLGFVRAFCAHVGLAAPINLQNLLGTVVNSLHNQEDDVSFLQHRAAAAAFFRQHFGQDFGLGSLERRVRPPMPMAGLVGDQLVAPNAVFGGDIRRFAEIAFGVVRPVAYLFNNP